MCEPHMVCESGHRWEQPTARKAIPGPRQRAPSDCRPVLSLVMDRRGGKFRVCRRSLPGQSAAGVPDRVSPLAAHRYPAYPTSLPVPTGTPHASGMPGHTRPVNKQHSIKRTSSTRRSLHRSIPQPLCTLRGRHIPASGRKLRILATA